MFGKNSKNSTTRLSLPFPTVQETVRKTIRFSFEIERPLKTQRIIKFKNKINK